MICEPFVIASAGPRSNAPGIAEGYSDATLSAREKCTNPWLIKGPLCVSLHAEKEIAVDYAREMLVRESVGAASGDHSNSAWFNRSCIGGLELPRYDN